jgi:hypothetical protein
MVLEILLSVHRYFLLCGDSEGDGVCTWWPRGKGAKDHKETRVAIGTK